ncbi:MAG: RNA 2',3'-cyclic phosphodiesterase [Bauldia sp.]|nr:RNA 2',3'-cyclic phosphodiesterase [Bauldia sp.]
MPRLFTGIEIPAEIGDRLSLLRGGLPGARWIDRENYHLTLRFVGDVDRDVAEDIADALGRVGRSGFEVVIEGLGALGSKKPHSLVARVRPNRALVELQAEHERLMQRIGLPAEQRKYTPHVTLARLRGASERDIANYLSLRGGFSTEPFPVERFVLFSSRNSVGGGPYVVEEEYALRPAARAEDRGRAHGNATWL